MSFYPLVDPITQTVITTYTTYTINNLVVTPFVQATMMIEMFTEDKQKVSSQYLAMIGQDYQNWNGSDNYLVAWVNSQLMAIQ